MSAMEEFNPMALTAITPRFLFHIFLVACVEHQQHRLVQLQHRWIWVEVLGQNRADRNLADRNLADRNPVDRHHRRLNQTLSVCNYRGMKIRFTAF
jgi:hypothetical protein